MLAPHAEALLKESYLLDNETPEEMFERVVVNVAKNKAQQKDFRWLLKCFTPNTPCLMNAGTPLNQLMACFVLPIEDSIEGIAKSIRDMMIIQKSGGGTGFVASHLRPEGDMVSSTGGVSSGPLSFLSIHNHAIGEIKQGGKRRGASLACIDVKHPDILKFIREKQDPSLMTNFNLSVGVTDDFMEAVNQDAMWTLINPRNGEPKQTIPAREIWKAIAECAWKTGEPGLLFLGTINKSNPTPELGQIEATNPCGEADLLPYEACVLGSINLHEIYQDGGFNYDLPGEGKSQLGEMTRLGVRFLDRVIDASSYPLPEIEEMSKGNRKIGLGVSGWGSLLFELGIPYNSEQALQLAKEIMAFINGEAVVESFHLAREYGSFPNYDKSTLTQMRRNACVTSIAPEGSRSLIRDVTSGIEPAFALVYRRLILNQEWRIVDKVFKRKLQERGLYSEELLDKIEANHGSVQGLKEIPKDMQEVFVTAHDMKYEDHIRMQAAFQEHVEQSISKTINLPNSAKVGDVENAYGYAYSLGCKGITVYRDGSRSGQILTTKHTPSERPEILEGQTQKFLTGCGSLYVTVNRDIAGDPHEVFSNHTKRSGCVVALLNALSRVTSISLRAGVDPQVVAATMRHQVCGECGDISSCADAVGIALEQQQNKLPEYGQETCDIQGGCQTCG